MDVFLIIVVSLAVVALLFSYLLKPGKKTINTAPFSESYRKILSQQVPFYQQLDEIKKTEFENKVQQFLAQTKITSVKTTVWDLSLQIQLNF